MGKIKIKRWDDVMCHERGVCSLRQCHSSLTTSRYMPLYFEFIHMVLGKNNVNRTLDHTYYVATFGCAC